MSNLQCPGFPSIDLAALENAVRTIMNLGGRVEAAAVPMPQGTTEQAARLRQLQWDGVLTRVLPLVTELEAIHRRCHELQALLSKAKQAIEQERQQSTTEVPRVTATVRDELQAQLTEANETIKMQREQIAAAASVNVADVRKELEAGFNFAQQHLVRSHEAMLANKLEALEERYRAKEAKLEEDFRRRDEAKDQQMTTMRQQYLARLATPNDRRLESIDKLEHLKLSSGRSSVTDPFVDRRPSGPRRHISFGATSTSMPAEYKRFAEASPEFSGGRAPLKKSRPVTRTSGPSRSTTELGHDEDTQRGLDSYELGSPRAFRGQRRVVRDSADSMSVSDGCMPVDARQNTDEGDNLRTEVVDLEEEEWEEEQGDEQELGILVRADSLAGVAQRAYNKIQFPTDGSWTEDLESWFIYLLRREGFAEKYIELTVTDPTWACFRNALVGHKRPFWDGSITSSPPTSRCDTCSRVNQPACVFFLHCDGVSAATPTNRQGKRWKLFLRTT